MRKASEAEAAEKKAAVEAAEKRKRKEDELVKEEKEEKEAATAKAKEEAEEEAEEEAQSLRTGDHNKDEKLSRTNAAIRKDPRLPTGDVANIVGKEIETEKKKKKNPGQPE